MIERIEDLIVSGFGIPLTPWTVVNAERLVPLLDRVRENMPEEMRKAKNIIERRDEMLADSQRKAAHVLEEAKLQAEHMLSDSQLMKAVELEAARIRQQVMSELEAHRRKAFEESEMMKAAAYEEARTTREGADRYAEAILTSLSKNLSEFQHVIQNGQRHLARTRSEASRMVSPLVGGAVSANGEQQIVAQQHHPGNPAQAKAAPPNMQVYTQQQAAPQQRRERPQQQKAMPPRIQQQHTHAAQPPHTSQEYLNQRLNQRMAEEARIPQ